MDRSYGNVPGRQGTMSLGSEEEGKLPQFQFPTSCLNIVDAQETICFIHEEDTGIIAASINQLNNAGEEKQ